MFLPSVCCGWGKIKFKLSRSEWKKIITATIFFISPSIWNYSNWPIKLCERVNFDYKHCGRIEARENETAWVYLQWGKYSFFFIHLISQLPSLFLYSHGRVLMKFWQWNFIQENRPQQILEVKSGKLSFFTRDFISNWSKWKKHFINEAITISLKLCWESNSFKHGQLKQFS